MKKVLILFFIVILILSLSGCSKKGKIEESIAEKILENASGVDVDVDGDVITMQDKDGQKVTFGSTEWPKSELAKEIPELKEGEITGVMEDNTNIMLIISKVKENTLKEYLNGIKKDYSEDILETNSKGINTYYGVNKNRIGAYLTYDSETEELSINIMKQEEQDE